jgi:hypothetical protein
MGFLPLCIHRGGNAVMSKYILGSRSRVVDHVPAHERATITLSAGALVLFRAGLLAGAMTLAWHYGLQ